MTKRILIVDDDAMNREILEAFLSMQKFEILMAHDGESALESLKTVVPDLVITDVKMFDMTGYDLCQHIKTTPSLQAIPVMIVTGYNSPEDEANARHVGADDFVTRPIDYLNFVHRVKTLVNRGVTGSSTAL